MSQTTRTFTDNDEVDQQADQDTDYEVDQKTGEYDDPISHSFWPGG